jgi:hypothetical protein
MENKTLKLIAAIALFIVGQSTVAKAQQKDSLKVVIDTNNVAADTHDIESETTVRYAIDGVIVTEHVFREKKDGLISLVGYPGKVFDPKYKGRVIMKVSKLNMESEPVVKLKKKALELGLKSTLIMPGN